MEILRYFIHDDFDGLRMEIAGSLVGQAARKAYEFWRSALFVTRPARLVVDISYVTEADEDGEAVLRAWREQDARIVAATPESQAIAGSIVKTLVASASPNRKTAGNPAYADAGATPSAPASPSGIEKTGLRLPRKVEHQVR